MAVQSIFRWAMGKACKLPARQVGKLQVEHDQAVVMRDGATLLADRYFMAGREGDPVVLMRSPYGRGGVFGLMAALIAERGFQVVLQSVRGTSGSGGELDPMRQERADGADTLVWIKKQAWYAGGVFAFGGSYLGNAVWAMAAEAGEQLDGVVLAMTLSNFRDELIAFGGFTQAGTLGWTQTVLQMSTPGQKMQRPKAGSLDVAHRHLPMGTIDEAAFGKVVRWWRDWVSHEQRDDPWWLAMDYSSAVTALNAPAAMVAGWQDIFLPHQLHDFTQRQAAGKPVSITIGPWSHASPGGMAVRLRRAVELFTALRAKQPDPHQKNPVRLYLQQADCWREYPSWPPPGSKTTQYYLRANDALDSVPPAHDEGSTSYVYDPADPTPAVHGPMVMGGDKHRYMDTLERRCDTLTFTGVPWTRDMDVIGDISVVLSIRSNCEYTDFYVCLCDVDQRGRSRQVVDGYLRLRPGEPERDESGVRRITISCWPTAYRFRSGHRLRLIIGSGAHPRYARNLGTGEAIATATKMVPARQEVLHGATHLSYIQLSELVTEAG